MRNALASSFDTAVTRGSSWTLLEGNTDLFMNCDVHYYFRGRRFVEYQAREMDVSREGVTLFQTNREILLGEIPGKW